MKTRPAYAVFAAAMLAPAAAFAHPGDHFAMTLGQAARHIATSPDHVLEIVFAILMAYGGWLRARARAAR